MPNSKKICTLSSCLYHLVTDKLPEQHYDDNITDENEKILLEMFSKDPEYKNYFEQSFRKAEKKLIEKFRNEGTPQKNQKINLKVLKTFKDLYNPK